MFTKTSHNVQYVITDIIEINTAAEGVRDGYINRMHYCTFKMFVTVLSGESRQRWAVFLLLVADLKYVFR